MKFWSTILVFGLTISAVSAQLSLHEISSLTDRLVLEEFILRSSWESNPTQDLAPKLMIPDYKIEAFFCRWEHKVDRGKDVVFRFRLGSPEQVNYLEGKTASPY